MGDSEKGFSRRNFLGGAAAVIGLAGAGLVAGCSPNGSNASAGATSGGSGTDAEYDVVIVGGGLAGLCAGVKLADLGITNTVIVDKAANVPMSTNSAIAGGAFNSPMENTAASKQAFLDAYMTASRQQGNLEFSQIITDRIFDELDWMRSHGCEFMEPFQLVPYEILQVTAAPESSKGMGPLCQNLLEVYTGGGGTLLTETKLIDIVLDDSGKALGVKVRDAEGYKVIGGKATVIATGGYVANKQLLEQFVGADGDEIMIRGQKLLTGDGILAIERAGGMFYQMGGMQAVHVAAVPPTNSTINPYNAIPQTIAIHKGTGLRYADECLGYVNNGKRLFEQPGEKICALVFSDAVYSMDLVQVDVKKFEENGLPVIEAASIEELAEKIEVPADVLRTTIEEFNAASDGTKTSGLAINKTALANKVEGPPYYAFYPLTAGSIMCFGGVYTDNDCRVLEPDGTPIGNLYGIGEVIGGIFKHDYLSGSSLNRCVLSGILAAEHIAGQLQ